MFQNIAKVAKLNTKQASLFAKNIMTILIQDVNNTMAGNQKEIIPSSWSPIIVKYSVYNINGEEKEALGANIEAGKNIKRNEKLTTETQQYYVMECKNIN